METIKWTCGRSSWSQLVTGGHWFWMVALVALLRLTIFTRHKQQMAFKKVAEGDENDFLTCLLTLQVKYSPEKGLFAIPSQFHAKHLKGEMNE